MKLVFKCEALNFDEMTVTDIEQCLKPNDLMHDEVTWEVDAKSRDA